MLRYCSLALSLILAGCASVGTDAAFPDMPDAVPSGPGALSGEHGEFVVYSSSGGESGKRKAQSVGDAQSRYGAVVSPKTEQPPADEDPVDESGKEQSQ